MSNMRRHLRVNHSGDGNVAEEDPSKGDAPTTETAEPVSSAEPYPTNETEIESGISTSPLGTANTSLFSSRTLPRPWETAQTKDHHREYYDRVLFGPS